MSEKRPSLDQTEIKSNDSLSSEQVNPLEADGLFKEEKALSKPSFWLFFLKTILQSPDRFLKHLNKENFRILKRALANESPTMILINLKNLLHKEHTPNLLAPKPIEHRKTPIPIQFLKNYEAFLQYRKGMKLELEKWQIFRQKVEEKEKKNFSYQGKNLLHNHTEASTYFVSKAKDGKINFRENFVCPATRFNSRMRATYLVIDHFLTKIDEGETAKIYFTEATTPFFAFYKNRLPHLVGSEYLGHKVPLGRTNKQGIRNEDLTQLTFADNAFDLIVCLEVLEHILNYQEALKEIYRTLQPNGIFIFSVPFNLTSQAITVRAELLPNGAIKYHLPPEYHGNPVGEEGAGILCYYHFGWDLLDKTMQTIGFETGACLIRSEQYAIVGNGGAEVAIFYGKKTFKGIDE